MKTITRTIIGAKLQSQQLLGLPYTHIPNTTLNEKWDIASGVLQDNPAANYPTIQYYAIGNGGHRMVVGADGIHLPLELERSPAHAALYKHLPFILRAPTDDLSPQERSRYGGRKEITAAGQTWVAYYLKAMNLNNVTTALSYNRVVNGVTSSTPFVPDSSNLNPVPPEMPSTGVITTSGDNLTVSTLVKLDFTAQDVVELLNVAQIMFGDQAYAKINEIAAVAACRKQVQAQAVGGGQFSYIEAVQAQCVAFISADYSAVYNNRGFDMTLDLGASEPLLISSSGI